MLKHIWQKQIQTKHIMGPWAWALGPGLRAQGTGGAQDGRGISSARSCIFVGVLYI